MELIGYGLSAVAIFVAGVLVGRRNRSKVEAGVNYAKDLTDKLRK